MKGKKWLVLAAIVLLLAGVGLLAYPSVRELQYKNVVRSRLAEYEQAVQAIEPDEMALLYKRIQAYNQHLYESGQDKLTDPFAYQVSDFNLAEYGFDEEIIGYLEVPQLDVVLPVYLGASPDNLHNGAALMSQTSIPIGGVNTNAVIAAHRGEVNAHMFRYIDRLQLGDCITLTNFQETLEYEVVEIKIIQPNDVAQVLIQPGRDLLTLLTCHPRGQNSQRYLVYCERVEA